MKVVQRFQAEDGSLFETEPQCLAYESKSRIKTSLESFVNSKFDLREDADTAQDVYDIILANSEELLAILSGERSEQKD